MKAKKSDEPPNIPSNRLISRYTTLPFVLDIIERKRIVLLPPDSWADRSDALVLQKYKKSKDYTCLLALCFTKGPDTIHHWNTFANGPAGCRVIFKEELLLDAVKKIKGVRTGDVEYIKLKDFARQSRDMKTWPFIKRWPYQCEAEFRMIYESTKARECKKMELEISIEFEYIHSIMINQSVPKKVFKSVKEFITSKSNIHVGLSRIHENPSWLGKF